MNSCKRRKDWERNRNDEHVLFFVPKTVMYIHPRTKAKASYKDPGKSYLRVKKNVSCIKPIQHKFLAVYFLRTYSLEIFNCPLQAFVVTSQSEESHNDRNNLFQCLQPLSQFFIDLSLVFT